MLTQVFISNGGFCVNSKFVSMDME